MKKIVFVFLLILGICFGIFSQTAGSPKDLVVLLDTSASMSNNFRETNDYLTGPFLREYLRIGDTFHLISFADTPRLEMSRRIEGVGDLESIIARILLIYPLEPSSNIAAALEFGERYMSSLPQNRSKSMVLVSDNNTQAVQGVFNTASARLSGQGNELRFIRVPVTTEVPRAAQSPAAPPSVPAAGTTPSQPAPSQPATTAPGAAASGPATTASVPPASTAPTATPSASTTPGTVPVQPSTGMPGQPAAGTTPSQPAPTQPATTTPGTAPTSPATTAPGAAGAPTPPASTLPGSAPSTATPPAATTPGSTAPVQPSTGTPSQTAAGSTPSQPPGTDSAAPSQTATPQTATPPAATSPATAQGGTGAPGQTTPPLTTQRPRDPAPSIFSGFISDDLPLYLIIILVILALLLLGLIIFLLSRRLVRSPNRSMARAATPQGQSASDQLNSYAQARNNQARLAMEQAQQKRKILPNDSEVVYAQPRGDGQPIMLNLFVEDQNTAIGRRNIHHAKSGARYSIGGGKSDFLIFLVPFPPRIADVYYDGKNVTLIPRHAKYFPDIGSQQVPACIGKTIRVLSDRNYEIFIRMELYEDPLVSLNKLLNSISVPGEVSKE